MCLWQHSIKFLESHQNIHSCRSPTVNLLFLPVEWHSRVLCGLWLITEQNHIWTNKTFSYDLHRQFCFLLQCQIPTNCFIGKENILRNKKLLFIIYTNKYKYFFQSKVFLKKIMHERINKTATEAMSNSIFRKLN